MITQDFQITVLVTNKRKKKVEQFFYFSVTDYSFAAITQQCDQFYKDFKAQYLILASQKLAKVDFVIDNVKFQ